MTHRAKRTAWSTRPKRLILLGVLAAATVVAAWATFAMGAAAPPAPTITAHPADSTASTSASFSFTDTQNGVSFQCSLDGSAFTSCTSPKSYPGPLAAGSHTFQVQAVQGSKTSATTSFGWTIDLSAPTPAISFPTNGGAYNTTGWNAGCAGGAGVCGTASDPSGIASVAVSVKQNATGKYWNGSAYGSAAEVFTAATGTTSWRLPLAVPALDGSYTVRVRATDAVGNTTAPASYPTATFAVDTVAPTSAPAITAHPASATNQASASFSFTDAETGVTGFLCRLDAGAFAACVSPKTYTGLADGSHTFSVEAVDAAGNAGPAASFPWSVDSTPPPRPTVTGPNSNSPSTAATFTFSDGEAGVTFQCSLDNPTTGWAQCASPKTYYFLAAGSHEFDVRAVDVAGNVGDYTGWKWSISGVSGGGQNFTIGGNAVGPLYPGGVTRYLDLSLTNPNGVPLYLSSLNVGLAPVSAPNAHGSLTCTQADFALVQYSGGFPIVLPPGTKTLSQLGYTQGQMPSVTMLDRPLNQDGCKGATLTFNYSGNAQS